MSAVALIAAFSCANTGFYGTVRCMFGLSIEGLAPSGFTGTLAWIGIIASQILFRKRLKKRGYDPETCLRAKVSRAQAWIPWFAMIAQFICLIMLAFGEGQLPIFILACAAVIIPMIVRVIAKNTGHVRDINALGNDEKTFDELYPDRN